MSISPFNAIFTANELSTYENSENRLTAAYASSEVDIYPYQVAAAMFALRSSYFKGSILADEGSLGKTYEALLIISQMWFEGKERIMVIVPTPLLGQWADIMDSCFSVPYIVIDSGERYSEIGGNNPFEQQVVVITTYDFAVGKADNISQIIWNIVVFDEAHHLSNIDNKTTIVLKEAVGGAYKLLLTATPMRNSIMDLYGLINFIDDDVLGDKDEFYKSYFRKPEKYHELAARISRYCFRTLRLQAQNYIKIPLRLPVTADYQLTSKELRLSAMLEEYLKKSEKSAFPNMDSWELSLMMWRSLSSSTFAFNKLLQGAIARVPEPELVKMQKLSETITANAKGQELLKALKKAFPLLKNYGANRKALIFTENRETQRYIVRLLKEKGYNVLSYSGEKSRDYMVMKRFKNDADILVSTDIAAEGFNLSFCSLVINYDLPYNILTLEQRIMRCHRFGQQSDVVVLNFMNRQNLADARMLELINKRILQFDGIIGMSDDVVGNFSENVTEGLEKAFHKVRRKIDIEKEFQSTLTKNELANSAAVSNAENLLFTTFTRDIADKVTVTPKYIKDRSEEINNKLWSLTKWFFDGKDDYQCLDETRTVKIGNQPQKIFTGSHLGRREYSIDDKTLPKSGRHTVCGTLAKNIIRETLWHGIPDSGSITIPDLEEPCKIGYYQIKIKPDGRFWESVSYYIFVGETAGGVKLTDEDCRRIMKLPVVSFTTNGDKYGLRDGISKTKPPHELDKMIHTDEFLKRAVTDTDEARREEINCINDRTYHQKQMLNRDIMVLKNQLSQIDNSLSRTSSVSERIDAEKKKASISHDLKKREQSLFLDSIRLETEAEEAVKALTEQANLTVEVKRQFAILVLN